MIVIDAILRDLAEAERKAATAPTEEERRQWREIADEKYVELAQAT